MKQFPFREMIEILKTNFKDKYLLSQKFPRKRKVILFLCLSVLF
jgi:hypothetical protein